MINRKIFCKSGLWSPGQNCRLDFDLQANISASKHRPTISASVSVSKICSRLTSLANRVT